MKYRMVRLFTPVLIWAIVGLIVAFSSQLILKYSQADPPTRLFFGLLPIIPGGFFIWAVVRGIRGLDEMQQRIQVESAAITFAVTVFLTFLFGGLQRAGLYTAHWDDIGNTMMLVWVVSYVFSAWRYQ